jgi:hypothetical protein
LKREGSERDIAAKIMERFATRAFRRPVEREWLDKLMTIYDRAISQGKDDDQAVGDMIAAVLISPRFLMRYENSRLEEDGPYRIDDYELASRLSFFLWSGPPDDVLMELAARGELRADEQLASSSGSDARRSAQRRFDREFLSLLGCNLHRCARISPTKQRFQHSRKS